MSEPYVGVLESPPDIRYEFAVALSDLEDTVAEWSLVVDCIIAVRRVLREAAGLDEDGPVEIVSISAAVNRRAGRRPPQLPRRDALGRFGFDRG